MKERITNLDNDTFYELVNNTTHDNVLNICLEVATPEQCTYLAVNGQTEAIRTMFKKEVLNSNKQIKDLL